MADREIEVLHQITELLEPLDPQAQQRIMQFLGNRFHAAVSTAPSRPAAFNIQPPADDQRELPGVAMVGMDDKIHITARDLKANSASDAAIRLVHLVAYAYNSLLGQKWISSKSVLVPILKHWRAYDGNTRSAIAANKGIVRNGDKLSLDFHAEQKAREYMDEILDEGIKGNWIPGGKKRVPIRPR